MTQPGKPVHIVTDSTADIPEPRLEGLPISIVPLTVDVDGMQYRDGIDLSRDDFVRALRAGSFPKTSQPPVGLFQYTYQQLVDSGFDIVSIHLASPLSGTMNSARTAAQAVGEQHIRIVDSTTVSMGTGFLALEAARMAVEGASADTIASHLDERRNDQRLYATLDSLEYLRRGGRIGRAAAFLGSALQMKPIIRVSNGQVEPTERVRTYRRAIERLTGLFEQDAPFDCVAVLHLDAEDAAQRLIARVNQIQPGLDIVPGQIGTVIGAYGGPGLVGFTGLIRPH